MTRIIENGRHVGPRPGGPESAPAAPPAPVREPARRPGGPDVAIGPEIRVNDRTISREQIAAEAQHHPADTPAEALQAAARALVVRELLLLEAERLGTAAEAQAVGPGRTETAEEALIRQLLDDEVQVPTADEAACRRYYDNNRRRFASPALYEARHILLAAADEDAAARAAAAETATALLATLRDRPARFAELAVAWSACRRKAAVISASCRRARRCRSSSRCCSAWRRAGYGRSRWRAAMACTS